jgi:hypothetical protein
LDAFPGWTPAGGVEVFDHESIYNLVDGQADSFFVYGFEQVAVRRYENAEGKRLNVEVWQLATPPDAYGLFSASVAGEPASVGRANDGDADPGRRLTFWQDRYFTSVYASQLIDDADLRGLAKALSEALPQGGRGPALLERLPAEGLVGRSAIFFHEELSIQDRLWLGGENLLGLGPDTDGILAQYDVGGAVAHLLLVQYPGAGAASAGLTALKVAQVNDLASAGVRDNLLGAVLGELDEAAASALLAKALGEG